MDPVAQSTLSAIADLGCEPTPFARCESIGSANCRRTAFGCCCTKVLANDAIEQVIVGPLDVSTGWNSARTIASSWFACRCCKWTTRRLRGSAARGSSILSLAEMQTIQAHFRQTGRDPTDAELETLAQTWSEHCSHKTLAGRIAYRGPEGERQFENMLKETIFAATQEIRKSRREADPTTGASACSRQRRRDPLRRASTTSCSKSRRTIIPRPWNLTAARTRAWAA